MLNSQNSRFATGSVEPQAVIDQLLLRVVDNRKAVVGISNALISVSQVNSFFSVRATDAIEEMRTLVKRGVETILKVLSVVDAELREASQFSMMLALPIQDLLEAGGKLSGSLENYTAGLEYCSRDATDMLEKVLADQRELRVDLSKKLDSMIRGASEFLVLLEDMIDDLQVSFAKLSQLADRR